MTTYSKETALYDTGAIATDIGAAGNNAKGYMTNVSNDGVFVHEYDTSDPQPSTTGENGVHIHNTVDIVNNGKVVASYGSTAIVGQNADGYSRTEITGDGIDFKRKAGSTDVVLAHIGYATGQAESGTSTKPYYTFGTRATDTASTRGNYSVAEGGNTAAIGFASHAEGQDTIASGNNSHAEGYGNANDGSVYKINGGASGFASHAEGYSSAASGDISHAEGDRTLASGDSSHAAGLWTIAQRRSQTVIGEYNAVDTKGTVSTRGDYSFIIGNGTSSARSNGFTVDWNGNVEAAGNIYPQNTLMADFVVEQGTSGIWTYRKWNSGFAECWGKYTGSIAVNTSSASYGGYRSALITTNFPFTFTAVPNMTATTNAATGAWVNNVAPSVSAAQFYLSCGASLAAASRTVNMYAVGQWK